MDRVTIRAVNDAFHLELPDAAALLLIESDLPGAAAEAELDAASAAARRPGHRTGAGHQRPGGRWPAPGAPARPARDREARRDADGGRRRASLEARRAAGRHPAGSREHGLSCGTFGHAGDGNLHPTFWWERGDPEAEARVTAACEELYRAAIDLGGTVTGEHGIGVARLKFLELQRGPGAVRVMHQIKAALDPLNLLNPGRAV